MGTQTHPSDPSSRGQEISVFNGLSFHFQEKMPGCPRTHKTTPAPVPFHATPILRAPSSVVGECMDQLTSISAGAGSLLKHMFMMFLAVR